MASGMIRIELTEEVRAAIIEARKELVAELVADLRDVLICWDRQSGLREHYDDGRELDPDEVHRRVVEQHFTRTLIPDNPTPTPNGMM